MAEDQHTAAHFSNMKKKKWISTIFSLLVHFTFDSFIIPSRVFVKERGPKEEKKQLRKKSDLSPWQSARRKHKKFDVSLSPSSPAWWSPTHRHCRAECLLLKRGERRWKKWEILFPLLWSVVARRVQRWEFLIVVVVNLNHEKVPYVDQFNGLSEIFEFHSVGISSVDKRSSDDETSTSTAFCSNFLFYFLCLTFKQQQHFFSVDKNTT